MRVYTFRKIATAGICVPCDLSGSPYLRDKSFIVGPSPSCAISILFPLLLPSVLPHRNYASLCDPAPPFLKTCLKSLVLDEAFSMSMDTYISLGGPATPFSPWFIYIVTPCPLNDSSVLVLFSQLLKNIRNRS